MFDFGFTELMLIAVVALIVVGPERLPKVARTAGHLLGRLQRYVSNVKSDISREMQLEDLKKLQQEVQQQARELETTVRSQMNEVESDLGKTASTVKEDLAIATEGVSPVAQASVDAPVGSASPPMPAVTPAPAQPREHGVAASSKAASVDSGSPRAPETDQAPAHKPSVEKP